ncbi:MAG TPA: hypothetical protein VFD90_07460 [Gaiellales bacterium]|jgi:hypothetical protein|nr:hypothetical protein [Gaiellales bacterium]
MLKRVAQRFITIPVYTMLSSAFPAHLVQSALTQEADRLRREIADAMPGNPAAAGFKSYSQADEDGVIEEIFRRIGEGGRTFAELGCGRGLENNSHLLLLKGWRGVWVDGDAENIAFIGRHFSLRTPRLSVIEALVTRDNAVGLVTNGLRGVGAVPGGLDLLSVDLDGNDLQVLLAMLEASEPRVVCIEYNAKYRPPLEVELPYDPDHRWAQDDYQGASLARILRWLDGRYTLVCCNVSGVNAFFVRNDVATAFSAYPVEALYQPPRYHLIMIAAGHPASLKFLAACLREEEAPDRRQWSASSAADR